MVLTMTKLWDKAKTAADDARILFRADRYDGAVSRAYYAMFTSARALLMKSGVAAARRHTIVWHQFSLNFGLTKLLDVPETQAVSQMTEIRSVADYAEVVTAFSRLRS